MGITSRLVEILCEAISLLEPGSHFFYCSLCFKERTKSFSFGNISLFNKFHSIDGFPGHVNNKLIDTAINNK
jgi:hypothetical protein